MNKIEMPFKLRKALLQWAKGNPKLAIIEARADSLNCNAIVIALKARHQYDAPPSFDAGVFTLAGKKAQDGFLPVVVAPSGKIVSAGMAPIMRQILTNPSPLLLFGIGPGRQNASDVESIAERIDLAALTALPGVGVYSAADETAAQALADDCLTLPGVKYVRIAAGNAAPIYQSRHEMDLTAGLTHLRQGRDLCLVSTGRMVHRALELAKALAKRDIDTGVVDLFKIKPLNRNALYAVISRYTYIATLEEHSKRGGIGAAMLETLSENGKSHSVIRFGYDEDFGSTPLKPEKQFFGLDLEFLIRELSARVW
jgi:transketolase